MSDVIIRKYDRGNEPAIKEITYRTGFNGEDLTGRGFFDDKRLFFLMHTCYYTTYEPQHCFVAVDAQTDTVVGFIAGTPDTSAQKEAFRRRMPPRIMLRALFITSWRYPTTYRTWSRMRRMGEKTANQGLEVRALAGYPAHLHINVLPEHQRRGIGGRLIARFEEHMFNHGVRGLHLHTSNYNRRAIPFYRKTGFSLIQETQLTGHPLHKDLMRLTFAKKLQR
jgi:ribosomal protein S18 acetylase RimI-like enzyme